MNVNDAHCDSDRDLSSAYLKMKRLSGSTSRADRLDAEKMGGVVVAVQDRMGEESVVAFLDIVVEQAAELDLLDEVGASVLEDAIVSRPDIWSEVAERCGRSVAWRRAVRSVWVDESTVRRLPPVLQGLVTPV